MPDLWAPARRLTAARIGLARSGASLATTPLLDFRLAHARARDAVHTELDTDQLRTDLQNIGAPTPIHIAESAAPDRTTYLLRPDLGRQLKPGTVLPPHPGDLAIVVADGLSAAAAQSHAPAVLAALLPALHRWRIAPIVIARHGRVALGDAIARQGAATSVLILLGERPGLSAPDSLGAYVTWNPTPSTTDADRNCISNIRPEGLPPAEAARRIWLLLERMRERGFSGVALKDEFRRRRRGRSCSANRGALKRLNSVLRCGCKARGLGPACPESDHPRRQPKGHRTAPFSVDRII